MIYTFDVFTFTSTMLYFLSYQIKTAKVVNPAEREKSHLNSKMHFFFSLSRKPSGFSSTLSLIIPVYTTNNTDE